MASDIEKMAYKLCATLFNFPPSFSQVVPGELTVVTGVPNSGKSEWIDALLCNINKQCGWKFVLCSMENKASHCSI
jgi:ribosome biogenesis GTPase A